MNLTHPAWLNTLLAVSLALSACGGGGEPHAAALDEDVRPPRFHEDRLFGYRRHSLTRA